VPCSIAMMLHGWRALITPKISVAAAIALAAILVVPDASYAASRKHKARRRQLRPVNELRECPGGACTGANLDRIGGQCSNDCYKRPVQGGPNRPRSLRNNPGELTIFASMPESEGVVAISHAAGFTRASERRKTKQVVVACASSPPFSSVKRSSADAIWQPR
jgi:hypothetical protein